MFSLLGNLSLNQFRGLKTNSPPPPTPPQKQGDFQMTKTKVREEVRRIDESTWEVVRVVAVLKTAKELDDYFWAKAVESRYQGLLTKVYMRKKLTCDWYRKIHAITSGFQRRCKIKPRLDMPKATKKHKCWKARIRYLHSKILMDWSRQDDELKWVRAMESKRSSANKRMRQDNEPKIDGTARKTKKAM